MTMDAKEMRRYLPEAGEGSPGAESPREEPPGRYHCPCCGYRTFPVPREDAIAFICPVCMWENDVFAPGVDEPSDENRGMTLRQGRAAFLRYGAVRPDLVRYARRPGKEEGPSQVYPAGAGGK